MYETTHSHHFTDNKLTSGQRTVRDFSTELMKLQDSYNSAIQRRDDAKKELAKEHNSQKLQKWEMEHLANRGRDYKEQLDKVHLEIVGLKSHMPMLGDNFIFPWTISSFCNNFQATNNQNNTLFFDRGGLPALSTRMDFHQPNVLLFIFVRRFCASYMVGSEKVLPEI